MVRLFCRHPVRDYAAWRKVYDGFDAERKGLGVTGHAVFQALDDPNDVTVWHDFADGAKARAFAESAALRSAMERAGVAGPPTIWFTAQA